MLHVQYVSLECVLILRVDFTGYEPLRDTAESTPSTTILNNIIEKWR